jgi:hypothetical protein
VLASAREVPVVDIAAVSQFKLFIAVLEEDFLNNYIVIKIMPIRIFHPFVFICIRKVFGTEEK